jgi:hypothetical protein
MQKARRSGTSIEMGISEFGEAHRKRLEILVPTRQHRVDKLASRRLVDERAKH